MTTTPVTTRRRAQRRSIGGRAQYLVTADEHSLADLELVLATLPLCATGRVFIEVPAAADIVAVTAPARMTVTWLVRARRSGAPGTARPCTPGTALARAVCAWSDEMLCEDTSNCTVVLLGGFLGTADIVDHLTEVRQLSVVQLQIPERFRPVFARAT